MIQTKLKINENLILFKNLREILLKVFFTIFVLGFLILGIFLKRKRQPSCILYGLHITQIENSNPIYNINDFLKENRFKGVIDSSNLLIEVRNIRSILKLKLNGIRNITFQSSFYLVLRCIKRREYRLLLIEFINKLNKVSFSQALTLIKRDFFDDTVFRFLIVNKQIQILLMTSNSDMRCLPASFYINPPMQNFMLWYSTNSEPIQPKINNNIIKARLIFPKTELIHLVWNKEQEKLLRTYGAEMVLIVGPILFQKKELKIKHPSKFIITYFDVDPYINLERKGSDYYTFYTEDKMINLLKSCLKSIEALPSSVAQIIQLQCKPKKILSKGRSKKYAKYRNDAFKKISGNVLPVDANLYSIVSESDLVIGVPYVSPVELAREMGTERAFVAFGMDVDHLLPNMWNKTEVIKEIDNLTELILDLVTKKF